MLGFLLHSYDMGEQPLPISVCARSTASCKCIPAGQKKKSPNKVSDSETVGQSVGVFAHLILVRPRARAKIRG